MVMNTAWESEVDNILTLFPTLLGFVIIYTPMQ